MILKNTCLKFLFFMLCMIGMIGMSAQAQTFVTTPSLRIASTSGRSIELSADNPTGTGSTITGTTIRFQVRKIAAAGATTFSSSGTFRICRIAVVEECVLNIPFTSGTAQTGWVNMTLPIPFYAGMARYYARKVSGTSYDSNVQSGVVQVDWKAPVANLPPVISSLSGAFNSGAIEGSFAANDPERVAIRDIKILLSRSALFPTNATCTIAPLVLSGSNQSEPNGTKGFRASNANCPGLIGTVGLIYFKAQASDHLLNQGESEVASVQDTGNRAPVVSNVVATLNGDKSLTVTASVADFEGDSFRLVGTISYPAGPSGITYSGRSNTDHCLPAGCNNLSLSNGSFSITWTAAEVAAFLQPDVSHRVRVQAIDAGSAAAPGYGVSGGVTVSAVSVGGTSVTGVSPVAARLDVLTTFTVTGVGLVDGMIFGVNACSGATEVPGGTAFQRQYSCTPRQPGSQTLAVSKTAGGANLFAGSVRVEHPVRMGNVTARGVPAVAGVSLFNGNLFMESTDMAVPGKGLSFVLTRSYNSYNSVYELEHGGVSRTEPWRFSTDLSIGYVAGTDGKRLYIQRPDGSGENYYLTGNTWSAVDLGNFSVVRGTASGNWTHITRAGVISTFESPAAQGRLLSVEDRDGNRLVFSYDPSTQMLNKVTDTSGRAYQFLYNSFKQLARVTDFTGRFVEYTYTNVVGGRISSFKDVRGNTTTYNYNTEGFLVSVVDPRLNQVLKVDYTTVYGNKGVQAITTAMDRAPAGRSCGALTQFTYCYTFNQRPDSSGFVTTVDGPLGLGIARVDFDNAGRPVSTSDGQSNTKTTKYHDAAEGGRYALSALAVQRQSPRGVQENYATQMDLDLTDGLTLGVTDPHNNRRSMGWNRNATDNHFTVATNTSALNHTTGFGYTPSARINRITQPVQQASNGSATVLGWTGGVLTSITNPLGQVTTLGRDAHGNLTTVPDPRNSAWVTINEYDSLGRVVKSTDPRGAVTRTGYDAAGNVTEVRLQATGLPDVVTTYTFDANGNQTTVTNPRGHTTTQIYDAGNRVSEIVRTVSGQTVRRQIGYDAGSRVVSITNENGNTAFRDLDAADRVTAERLPLGRTLRYEYDADSRVRSRTDAENRTTLYEYDRLGQVTAVRDPANQTTRYEYDADGRLWRKTDAMFRVTEYGYDGNGNLRTVKDPAGVVSSADYNDANQMVSRTDPRGKTTRFEYDAAGNLTRMIDPLGNQWTYSFDAVGNLVQSTVPGGRTTTRSYDAHNRLARIVFPDGSQVSYTWDANGNLSQMGDSVGNTQYFYDEANRLTTLVDPFGNSVSYSYDAAGNRRTVVYPGNRTVSYGYDAAERMATVTDWASRTASYNYNLADQITRLQHGNGSTADYSYHPIHGRLTALVNKQANGAVISSHQLTLDAAGGITQADEVLPLEPTLSPRVKRWTVDDANRVQKDTVSGDSFEHDAAGRLIRQIAGGQGSSFSYNELDLLTALSGPGRTESYRYNGQGHRVERTVNGAVTRYLVEPNGDLPNVLAELSGSNVGQRFYVYGAGGLLSQVDAAGTYHAYHAAPIGNVLALTNATGVVSDSYAYTPYGETTANGSTLNPFRYVGKLATQSNICMPGDDQLRSSRARSNFPSFCAIEWPVFGKAL
jgi:YD repeat-containing protein